MTSPVHRQLAAVLLTAILAAASGASAFESGPAKEPAGTPPAHAVLQGRVTAIEAEAIRTTIVPRDDVLDDGDFVRIGIAGRLLDARFFAANHLARLLGDPARRETLDVDVVCTLSADNALIVIGLGGELAEWLGAKPRMRVTVVKP